ncbi:hypothetical protein OWM07_03905 [Deferribacter thermophilus]
MLKAKYTDELNSIVESLKILNLKIIDDGVGFTGASDCKECKNKPGDFWLFITYHGKNINKIIHKDTDKIIKNSLKNGTIDILYMLKHIKLNKLLNDRNFRGFLISGIWGISEKLTEITKPKKYITAEYYISKELFLDYLNGKDYNQVIDSAFFRSYLLK